MLRGAIPTEIGRMEKLSSLKRLAIGLSGTLPTELGMFRSATLVRIGQNGVTLTIPTELGRLTTLTTLGLYLMSVLTGTIPPEPRDGRQLDGAPAPRQQPAGRDDPVGADDAHAAGRGHVVRQPGHHRQCPR